MHQHDNASDAGAAAIKLFWIWLSVGISQMTPLQFVQFAAALWAIVYTALQTYILLRDKIINRKKPEVARDSES